MKRNYLKRFLACTGLSLVVALAGCGGANTASNSSGTSSNDSYQTASAVTDTTISANETNATFSITTDTGAITQTSVGYTLSAAGVYTLSGRLNGQILVEAGEEDEVELALNGVTIEYSSDSPVKILSADKVEISAKSGTENVIKDTRSAKTTDVETQGESAVYAKTDLKFKGTGILVIQAGYNDGVHTTKDLKIQKLSLKVTAYGTALQGNDSVTVLSGQVVAISTHADGVKTQNTDANSSGETRGDVTLTGGSIAVYAAGDGFDSAHNFTMAADEEGNAPNVCVYTGSYSGYTASGATTTSYKGVKVQNVLAIGAGSVELHTYDDGLHADYGTTFTAGGTGEGTINITGGTITMSVYAPANKATGGGRMGPGGWGNQQTVSGADAIHADYKLNISGGSINIDSAYEGLEANVITVSGGQTYVTANDDGVNACSGRSTPLVSVTGGYLDVTVAPNGDTDGIDSNGSYSQTGGVVIARGPNSNMAAALDADGTVSITGGTLIVLGYARVTTGGSVRSYSLSLHSAGTKTVKINGTAYTFTNANSYGRTYCYSSVTVSA